MPGGEEVEACRHHVGRVRFEDGAFADEEVEVALFRRVKAVAGRTPEGAAGVVAESEAVPADRAQQGGGGGGGHSDHPRRGRPGPRRQGPLRPAHGPPGVSYFTAGETGARLSHVKSEHLPLLNSVSAPALHPDGTRAVVSVLRPDFDADAYVGQLWTVPLDPDQPARRLTRGFRDAAPDFSPDGQVLAFLRAAAGGKPQLHIVEAAGGEPQPVTDAPLGVSAFAWSPDSRHIVYSARTPEDGPLRQHRRGLRRRRGRAADHRLPVPDERRRVYRGQAAPALPGRGSGPRRGTHGGAPGQGIEGPRRGSRQPSPRPVPPAARRPGRCRPRGS